METTTLIFDEILHETDNAILFDFGGEEAWIPKSQIHNDPYNDGSEVEVSAWFVEKEGLEGYES